MSNYPWDDKLLSNFQGSTLHQNSAVLKALFGKI